MLLLIPLMAALVIALARGGSVRNLAALPLRGGWLIMASFAIQFLFYASPLRHAAVVARWNSAIYLTAITLALAGALCNWRLSAAVRLATLGVILNTAVIVANGGHMPVNAATMRAVRGTVEVRQITDRRLYGNTRPATSASHLLLFSDVIPVLLPGGFGNVYSVGDLLLSAGVATLVYGAARGQYARVTSPTRAASFSPLNGGSEPLPIE